MHKLLDVYTGEGGPYYQTKIDPDRFELVKHRHWYLHEGRIVLPYIDEIKGPQVEPLGNFVLGRRYPWTHHIDGPFDSRREAFSTERPYGVTMDKAGYYRAQVRSAGKVRFLGRFTTIELAVEQVNKYTIVGRPGQTCYLCGTAGKLTLDHIIPTSRKGPDESYNHGALCRSCNSSKGDLLPKEMPKEMAAAVIKKLTENLLNPPSIIGDTLSSGDRRRASVVSSEPSMSREELLKLL